MANDLETVIREAMLRDGVQALNLFRNADGGFQANIGYVDRGAAQIVRHEDPVSAIALALKKRKKAAVDIASQFEDLLG